jgi:hypothetical protein
MTDDQTNDGGPNDPATSTGRANDGSTAAFDCSICGKTALQLFLAASGEPEPADPAGMPPPATGWLRVESDLWQVWLRVSEHGEAAVPPVIDRDRLRTAMVRDDVAALYSINLEMTPNWCPTCAALYCRDHWRTWEVFDEEYPMFHDSTRGACPNGHERMLSD